MILLKKSIGFLAAMVLIPSVYAATARPAVITTATARMPTMTTQISGNTSSSTGSTSSLLANAECVEAYTDCLKGADVCGPNFEECTNKTLFYAKRPQCASTLMQCTPAGIGSLFGTNNTTLFANKNSDGTYVYPTDGSVLGQLIEAAHINNRYDTSTCVRRYTTCLKKDDVCGADFELCTSNTEFKKQKLFCESTLARCQNEGLTELFGSTNTANNPTATSRIGIMISEGASLAAVNAVATCYKVADQCILNACAQNPYKCKEGTSHELVDAANNTFVDNPSTTTNPYASDLGAVNRNEISAFIKNACADTIGGNKYCYATSEIGDGKMPTDSQLKNEENRNDVFTSILYGDNNGSGRWNDSMKAKIDDLIEAFDKKTKERCQTTIVDCAMRSCGGGSGLACYNIASSGTAANASVDITLATNSIKSGCEPIVNNDLYCKYSAATFQTATGGLNFLNTSIFDALFTSPNDTMVTNPDPVSAVATLNQRLATSYNPTAMTNKTKQCQNTAKACVKNMCGSDYSNCYRNRTDVASAITQSGSSSFDRSMNKVGGVLDRTIVVGLCMDTVKNNAICEELLDAQAYAQTSSTITTGGAVWGDAGSVGQGWLNVGATGVTTTTTTSNVCTTDGGVVDDELPATMQCGSTMSYTDMNGETKTVGYNTNATAATSHEYATNLLADQIFQTVVNDLEIEAQAQYNAKLTKQQNACMAGNTGGIMGSNDTGSTFLWAKLKTNKVPASYVTNGLTANQFVASNELYGSFCRIRVTLQSDDKDIQEAIRKGNSWSTAYFAAGDTFTCGSWIPQSALEQISKDVAARETGTTSSGKLKTGQAWATAGLSLLGAVGGGIGGSAIANSLQKSGGLGGLMGTSGKKSSEAMKLDYCAQQMDTLSANIVDTKCYKKSAGNSINVYSKTTGSKDSAVTTNLSYDLYEEVPATGGACTGDNVVTGSIVKQLYNNVKTQCNQYKNTDITASNKSSGNLIGAGVGAAVGGVILGVGGAQIMKASNRSNFDDAQNEWMKGVGQHIRCFIGSEEVGEYSDIISIEID